MFCCISNKHLSKYGSNFPFQGKFLIKWKAPNISFAYLTILPRAEVLLWIISENSWNSISNMIPAIDSIPEVNAIINHYYFMFREWIYQCLQTGKMQASFHLSSWGEWWIGMHIENAECLLNLTNSVLSSNVHMWIRHFAGFIKTQNLLILKRFASVKIYLDFERNLL